MDENDRFTQMVINHGVVHGRYRGKKTIELRETIMRWIAVYFSGDLYKINGHYVNKTESENIAYDLLNLLGYLDRRYLRK